MTDKIPTLSVVEPEAAPVVEIKRARKPRAKNGTPELLEAIAAAVAEQQMHLRGIDVLIGGQNPSNARAYHAKQNVLWEGFNGAREVEGVTGWDGLLVESLHFALSQQDQGAVIENLITLAGLAGHVALLLKEGEIQ